jgi:hypothetical protein
MHTGVISFCDRIAFNIKCSNAKDYILDNLQNKYNIKILQKHWFKLDDKQFKYVKEVPHLTCLRSNGNPYYVYFTKYEDVPQIMFIDKKVHPGYQKPRIILGKGLFDEEIFEDTILEGEMVKDKNSQWLFLINDVIAYKGQYLSKVDLLSRLKCAADMLEKHYNSDNWMDVCTYQIKKYYHCTKDNIEEMIMFSRDLPYTNRGIYFTPVSMKYKPKLINFNDELIKNVYRKVKDNPEFREKKDLSHNITNNENNTNIIIKPTNTKMEDHEKMLWLRKTEQPDIYDIYEQENSQNSIGIVSVPTLILSKMLRNVFKDLNVATSVPFKCEFSNKFDKWIPIKCLI